MRIAVLNGPNLNLLGDREPDVYGRVTLGEIERSMRARAEELETQLEWVQSNHEGELVDLVQRLPERADGAIVNAAGLTHTSVALRDALVGSRLPFIEVHLSNIFAREEFRRRSLLADVAVGVVAGLGAGGYVCALNALVQRLRDA
ncbi:MAG TPA: type II 3-dehydroquinate dehydratase [Gemmatimonadales bacterium]|nr:type II 3-dehydroquinate dehydratase [Gemmatimonadales bacterium]